MSIVQALCVNSCLVFRSMHLIRMLSMLMVSVLASGCLSMQSYVDPTLPSAGFGDLKPSPSPQPLQLLFEFQTNGNGNATTTEQLRPEVMRILNESKLFSTVTAGGAQQSRKLFVTMNNLFEKDAASKGFATGLTFGLAGTTVTDRYEMNASYQVENQAPVHKTYQHALHSTIGNTKGPEGLEPMKTADAFRKVFEQLLLNLLKDLSHEGLL